MGIVAGIEWIAARRRGWDVRGASRVFVERRRRRSASPPSIFGMLTVHASWDAKRQRMQDVAAALDAAGAPDDGPR